ncbi:hypothetical protein [Vitreimonas sp.]|uniref:hypothetical protein n=1 Tax=Vitreimonas sp. TaxID=3069702 RepID=UPI002ED92C35
MAHLPTFHVPREAEREALHEACASVVSAPSGQLCRPILSIVGSPKLGKSTLCVEFEHFGQDLPLARVIRVDVLATDGVGYVDALVKLRNKLSRALPACDFVKFDIGVVAYLAMARPLDAKSLELQRSRVRVADVIEKGAEGASQAALNAILQSAAGSSGAAVAAVNAAAHSASALATIWQGGLAAASAVVLTQIAKRVVQGVRRRAIVDPALASSPTLKNLVENEDARVPEFEMALPRLLAEDLNAASEGDPLAMVPAFVIDDFDLVLRPEESHRAAYWGGAIRGLVGGCRRAVAVTTSTTEEVASLFRNSSGGAERLTTHRLTGLCATEVRARIRDWCACTLTDDEVDRVISRLADGADPASIAPVRLAQWYEEEASAAAA